MRRSSLPDLTQYVRLLLLLTSGGLGYTLFRRLARRAFFYVLRREPRSRASRAFLAFVSASFTVAALVGVLHFYVYYGFDYQPDIYRSGSRNTNKVAITFDDGPSREFTPVILDILREYEVPATFFLVGVHVEKYPDVAQRIVEEGHEIGNHTYRHINIPTASNRQIYEEVIRATRVITTITGRYPDYIRPPRGMYDARFRRLAHALGQKIVLWTVSSRDWRYGTTHQVIVRRVVSAARGGDIILFHDSGALIRNEGGDRSATVKALPLVIEGLRQKGLDIVPLSVLLEEERGEEFPHVEVPE
ncbi:MAG: polysaccharide deacetylase family protein [Firmicutes bacterium]|nr:polysaccharide deacetylase family protein [Bacillota bacterium]